MIDVFINITVFKRVLVYLKIYFIFYFIDIFYFVCLFVCLFFLTASEVASLVVIQFVPIKTLQSLHAKFRVVNESFETNLNCTILTKN